jgi:hypothetical protein
MLLYRELQYHTSLREYSNASVIWPKNGHLPAILKLYKAELEQRRSNFTMSCVTNDSPICQKRIKTSQFHGVSLHNGKWAARLHFHGTNHHLGSFPDEITAALIYDYIGCRLQLAHFPVNFLNRRLEEPFLSPAKIKADQLIQLGRALPTSTVSVSEKQRVSSQLEDEECVSEDDVPILSRVNVPQRQQTPSIARNDESESEDDIPLLLRITPPKPRPAQADISERTAPVKSLSSAHLNWPSAKTVFRKFVAEGPVYICSCCRQLWFKRSVVALNSTKRDAFPPGSLTSLLSKDGKEYICTTCNRKLSKGKLPLCAPQNVPDFPILPEPLRDLTDLENHLLAPRIPFMQVRMLPRGKQFQLSGAVVNVPTDLSRVQTLLPRRFGTEETVALKLKRRLRYTCAYKFQNVRPDN